MGSRTGKNRTSKPAAKEEFNDDGVRTKGPSITDKKKNGGEEEKLDWLTVDPDTLEDGPYAKSYGEYVKARELSRDKQTAFEENFIAEARKRGSLSDDQSLRFGYRWGQVSVAIIDASERRAAGEKKERKTFKM